MTRGKYTARRVNRLAQLDDEITEQLRADLQRITAERDELRRDRDQARRDRDTEARRLAADLAADELRQLRGELAAERADRGADRERYGREAFRVVAETGGNLSSEGWQRFAELFGLGDQLGQLVVQAAGGGSRQLRRVTSRKARMINEFRRQTEGPQQ